MANKNPALKGRRRGQLNKSTIEKEQAVVRLQDWLIASGQAKASDFDPCDSLTWMEVMSRDNRLPMQERREFAKSVAPYRYARKNAIQVDPHEDEHDIVGMSDAELEQLKHEAAGIVRNIIEHDGSENVAEGN
ncbi:hypothetical protein BKE38_08675 [Pseudoroseomonas deserti]|uniref:Uncharacterized protein n=1 Tax=Teichococcus deserti TaxID=1817963 RepID=A0A1V2H4P5_9PROT|nr:hypothetical protein [Pseudoroseomonas deserti]ONG55731.1 hypothetical protein BKE38_08675 [Pseudoroseomonas deserti]